MPMDKSRYAANFDERARAVKEAADWTCEECGRPCRRPGETLEEFEERIVEMGNAKGLRDYEITFLDEIYEHPQRFTLTAAHPDHDPSNPEAVLRAWCSGCHLRHDAPRKGQDRRAARKARYGQMTMEEVG